MLLPKPVLCDMQLSHFHYSVPIRILVCGILITKKHITLLKFCSYEVSRFFPCIYCLTLCIYLIIQYLFIEPWIGTQCCAVLEI
jgi:hypothetical protein